MKLAKLAALSFTAIIATSACTESATEIVLTIDTSFGVPCTINRVVVEVTNSAGQTQTESILVDEDTLPGSLTLVASASPGQLVVRVTGFLDELEVAVAEERGVTFEDGKSKEVRFLLDSSCTSGTCGATAQGDFNELPSPAARIACGQERYTSRESLALLTNACLGDTLGSVMTSGDDEIELASPLDPQMPFPFFFFGKPVNNIWVGDNGYVAFSTDPPAALSADVGDPRSLGEAGGFPAPGVLPFWDKLRVGQRVCFAVDGNEPNRTLWITWDRACFGPDPCGGAESGTLTFSAGLEESTNSIHIGYHTMVATGANAERAEGLSSVIGVSSGNGPSCSASECNADGQCPSGDSCGYFEFSALSTSLDPIPQVEFRPVTP